MTPYLLNQTFAWAARGEIGSRWCASEEMWR